MKAKRQGLSSFWRDATGGFSLGTVIATLSFLMICRIAEKERHPDPWVVAPLTILCLSYFALDTVVTRAVALSTKETPDTVVQADTAPITSENTTVTPDPKSLTS